MYVKRTTVKRGGTSYVYLRLVEAYRDAGKVRHRVVANLGREDELKASGQLEQLAAGFARLDPPPWGARREVGPLLLVHHYLDRLGLESGTLVVFDRRTDAPPLPERTSLEKTLSPAGREVMLFRG